MIYDDNNIFAKILKGDIPNSTIYEDDFVLAFHDISPQAKVHAIVIPKGSYIDYTDFIMRASTMEIIGFNTGVLKSVQALNLLEEGYRIVTNIGSDGRQEVPHLHYHILGGEQLQNVLVK